MLSGRQQGCFPLQRIFLRLQLVQAKEGPFGWRRLMVLKMLGLAVDVVIAQATSCCSRSKLRMNGLNMVGSEKVQEKMWKGQDKEAFRWTKDYAGNRIFCCFYYWWL